MARTVLPYVLITLAGIVVLKLLVSVLERHVAFYPLPGVQATPTDLGIPYEEISLETSDGETVSAWWLPHPEPRAEVVFWHGNGGNLSLWVDILAGISRQGLSVLALDYRGYGTSTGSPSEQGLYRDTDALVARFFERLHRPETTVVYWGRSLGGVFAAYATTVETPDALILESSFPSARSLLSRDPVLKILSLFSSYRFPTASFLRSLDRPVLVVHGDADTIVPFEQGRRLFDGLRTEKRFVTLYGADHNDFYADDDESYWEPIRGFIEEVGDR